jgi:hypothetical protein
MAQTICIISCSILALVVNTQLTHGWYAVTQCNIPEDYIYKSNIVLLLLLQN